MSATSLVCLCPKIARDTWFFSMRNISNLFTINLISKVDVLFGDSDVGDIDMFVTSLCWWLNDDDWFEMLVAESLCSRLFSLYWWFSQCIKSVTYILNRPPTSQTPTHLVSNIRHQHRCNPEVQSDLDNIGTGCSRCNRCNHCSRNGLQTLQAAWIKLYIF